MLPFTLCSARHPAGVITELILTVITEVGKNGEGFWEMKDDT